MVMEDMTVAVQLPVPSGSRNLPYRMCSCLHDERIWNSGQAITAWWIRASLRSCSYRFTANQISDRPSRVRFDPRVQMTR